MVKTHAEFMAGGFAFFPMTEDPPTYRSALVSSSIDFVYHRNVTLNEPEVARVFIALHRPVAATFAIPSRATAPEKQLEPAYG
jgi:endonuclease/exonuclease/phosphatase (EEP) superfamily protein YafD